MSKKNIKLSDEDFSIIDSIIYRRFQEKISQKKLAELAGISQSLIAKIETYKYKPTEDILKRITQVLFNTNDLDDVRTAVKQQYKYPQEEYGMIFLSKDIIKNKEEYEKLRFNHEGLLNLSGLKSWDIYENIPRLYYYKMPDDSLSPEIKKGDGVLIKYINTPNFDYRTLIKKNNTICVFSDSKISVIRRVNIIHPYLSKGEDFKIYCYDNNSEPFYIDPNNKTDLKLVGVFISLMVNRMLEDINFYYLLGAKWLKE